MRATIRQVAERAQVSRTTVSNVLLGRPDSVGPEKRQSVLRAVQELNYIPVRSTLQNRHVETRVFALSLGDPQRVWWSIHAGTYRGMCEAALKYGYDLLTLLRPDPDWALDRQQVQFLDRRSDGFVFASPVYGESADTFETLAKHEIPTVVCYRRDVPEGVAWVDPDNRSAIFQAAEHLMARGHRRIAHLTEVSQLIYDSLARRECFQEAMHHFGMPECADWIVETEYQHFDGIGQRLLKLGATAVICLNDRLALDLWATMKTEGFQIPHDLSIIGIDNEMESKAAGLSTMSFSYAQVGQYAIESLIAQMQGTPPSQCCHIVPVEFRDRASVRDLNN